MDDFTPPTLPMATVSPEKRLESWKEIATYLKRDIRTVQRWERSEGLPVHRHFHGRQGTVYAFQPEVEAWWQSRRARLDAQGPETPGAAESTAGRDRLRSNRPAGSSPEPARVRRHWSGGVLARIAGDRIARVAITMAAGLAVLTLTAQIPAGTRLLRDLTGWFRLARASSNPQPAKAQAQALYLQGRYYW